MRARDHLLQAVNSLYQAASARKAEIDELRRVISSNDIERRSRLTRLEQEEVRESIEAARTPDDKERAEYTNDVRKKREEENRLTHDFNRLKKETDAAIAQKQRNVDDIQSLIQHIESSWLQI